jgi:hypothetical protein
VISTQSTTLIVLGFFFFFFYVQQNIYTHFAQEPTTLHAMLPITLFNP